MPLQPSGCLFGTTPRLCTRSWCSCSQDNGNKIEGRRMDKPTLHPKDPPLNTAGTPYQNIGSALSEQKKALMISHVFLDLQLAFKPRFFAFCYFPFWSNQSSLLWNLWGPHVPTLTPQSMTLWLWSIGCSLLPWRRKVPKLQTWRSGHWCLVWRKFIIDLGKTEQVLDHFESMRCSTMDACPGPWSAN